VYVQFTNTAFVESVRVNEACVASLLNTGYFRKRLYVLTSSFSLFLVNPCGVNRNRWYIPFLTSLVRSTGVSVDLIGEVCLEVLNP